MSNRIIRVGLPPAKSAQEQYPYQNKIEAAKIWLGSNWLLAQPVGRHYATPAFLRPQI